MKSYFSRIFGSSPVFPLRDHMARAIECAQELVPYFEAVNRGDWETATRHQERVATLEDEADTLKKQLRKQLPTNLFMSMDRRDVLELLRTQDKVANKAKDIAGLILGREMQIPPSMQEDFMVYLRRSLAASEQALQTVSEIEELVETGFRGAEVDVAQAMLKELDAIETDTDKMQVSLRRQLRGLEAELPPVDVIFLYKVIEWVGDLADIAQRVGSRIQLMLAE